MHPTLGVSPGCRSGACWGRSAGSQLAPVRTVWTGVVGFSLLGAEVPLGQESQVSPSQSRGLLSSGWGHTPVCVIEMSHKVTKAWRPGGRLPEVTKQVQGLGPAPLRRGGNR